MEGSNKYKVTDETPFVEIFGDNERAPMRVMAFEDNKNAWVNGTLNGGWTDWEWAGNSADYESNEHFANMDGLRVKLDKLPWL